MIGFIFLLYFVFTIWLLLSRPVKLLKSAEVPTLTVSIVIAYRNEAKNLPKLIDSIKNQVYPATNIEVLMINDHSEDSGYDLVNELTKDVDCKMVHQSLNQEKGKKAALSLGISLANNDIILCTDADCDLNPNWVITMLEPFNLEKIKMVLGSVKLTGTVAWFHKIQSVEFSSLMAITMLTCRRNRPIIANGANIAFRKTNFNNTTRYLLNKDVNTGDDVFLLHEFKRAFGKGSVHFVEDENALVTTEVKQTGRSFLKQRIRWASKSKRYSDYDTLKIGVVLILVNLAMLWCFIGTIMGLYSVGFFIGCFSFKWLLDLLIVQRLPSFIRPKSIVKMTLLLSIFYPLYSVGIALVSLFYRPEWKGRKI